MPPSGSGKETPVADREQEKPKIEDGRPAEVRDGESPQSSEERDEDVQDESTVESVGY
jgi:hypothetical protein